MHIVRLPRQQKVLSCLVFFSLPLFVLNLWVMNKGSLAQFLSPEKTWLIASQAIWMLITLRWLLKVRWQGLWSVVILGVTMLCVNIYYLVVTKNYALAFYALFLVIMSALYALHLYRSLTEVYYDSGRRWYEGNPKFLPNIEARILMTGAFEPVKLSRLGVEGCYAYPFSGRQIDKAQQIELKMDDLELNCAVELVSREKTGFGTGWRFLVSSADQYKEVRDFIDRVRSSGYVA